MANAPEIGDVYDREADRDTEAITKEQANYKYQGGVAARRCGDCYYFEASLCTRGITGIDKVDADDICDEFRQRLQDGSMSAQEAEAVLSQAGAYRSMEMFITKVIKDRQTGVRRWFATSSGIKRDQYGERMSVELFDDFIRRIEERDDPPVIFTSTAWKGGLPYLGVAHYLDLDGYGIVGDTEQVWKDRTVFKAKGTFRDTPLAVASYDSIKSDIEERTAPENRVRVSIAFVDWGHEHEGQGSFERKSLIDRCGWCEQGIGEKIYRQGHLVHLALTRRPAYLETEITLLEEKSMSKSKRHEDAASIVGEEMADELEAKSADLIERAEGEGIDPSAIVVRQDEEEAAPSEDCEGLEGDELAECLERKRGRSDGAEAPEGPAVMASLGGAKSLDEADEFLAKSKGDGLLDSWAVMASVLTNIAGEEKKEPIVAVINDFQSRLDVMALKAILSVNDMVEKASEEPVVEKQLPSIPEECRGLGGDELADCLKRNKGEMAAEAEGGDEAPVERTHPLDEALESFRSSFDAVMSESGSEQERLMKLQESFNLFGEAVRKSVAEPVIGEDTDAIVKAVQDAVAPMYQKLAILEQKIAAGTVVERTVPTAPKRRSVVLPPATGAQLTRRAGPGKPAPLKEIIRRSVGIR